MAMDERETTPDNAATDWTVEAYANKCRVDIAGMRKDYVVSAFWDMGTLRPTADEVGVIIERVREMMASFGTTAEIHAYLHRPEDKKARQMPLRKNLLESGVEEGTDLLALSPLAYEMRYKQIAAKYNPYMWFWSQHAWEPVKLRSKYFRCYICENRNFKSIELLRRHFRDVHLMNVEKYMNSGGVLNRLRWAGHQWCQIHFAMREALGMSPKETDIPDITRALLNCGVRLKGLKNRRSRHLGRIQTEISHFRTRAVNGRLSISRDEWSLEPEAGECSEAKPGDVSRLPCALVITNDLSFKSVFDELHFTFPELMIVAVREGGQNGFGGADIILDWDEMLNYQFRPYSNVDGSFDLSDSPTFMKKKKRVRRPGYQQPKPGMQSEDDMFWVPEVDLISESKERGKISRGLQRREEIPVSREEGSGSSTLTNGSETVEERIKPDSIAEGSSYSDTNMGLTKDIGVDRSAEVDISGPRKKNLNGISGGTPDYLALTELEKNCLGMFEDDEIATD